MELQGGLTVASCRVRCGRVQKSCLHTGDPKDSVKIKRPRAHCGIYIRKPKGLHCKAEGYELETRRQMSKAKSPSSFTFLFPSHYTLLIGANYTQGESFIFSNYPNHQWGVCYSSSHNSEQSHGV